MRLTLAMTAPSHPSASSGQLGADKNQGPVVHQTHLSFFHEKNKKKNLGRVAHQTQLSRNTYIQGTHIYTRNTAAHQTQLSRNTYIQGTHIDTRNTAAHQTQLSRNTYIQGTYIYTHTRNTCDASNWNAKEHTHTINTHTYIQATPVAHQIERPT